MYKEYSPKKIWDTLLQKIENNKAFKSVGNTPKLYKIDNYNNQSISFSGGDRTEKGEHIPVDDFISVIEQLKEMDVFNTNSSKDRFRGTKIYKKRSPLFGLLLSNGIIEKI